MNTEMSGVRFAFKIPKSQIVERVVEVPKIVTVEKEVPVTVEKQVCMKNCCPKLSAGCDCGVSCRDFYFNPLCNFVGITGLLEENQCIVYDEQWGGCGTCIGCKDDCPVDVCPFGNPFGSTPGLLSNPVATFGSAAFANFANQQFLQPGQNISTQLNNALNQFGSFSLDNIGQQGLNAQQFQQTQFNQDLLLNQQRQQMISRQ